MAKFTQIAIKGAAKALAKYDGHIGDIWDLLEARERKSYMREAEKILMGAQNELKGIKD